MASFSPETIAVFGSFPITNTVIHTLFVDTLLFGTSLYISKKIKLIPSFFQNSIETIMETFYNLVESIAHANTTFIFPFVMSFFLFILIANLTSLLPGFGSIGIYKEHMANEKTTLQEKEKTPKKELIPILRGATSDLNVTFALALISVVATHGLSIRLTGIKDYIGRYISLNPINLFVGILEIAAEITKIVSLSFRLFGNIYAGEVALSTVSNLFAFLFPLPFLFLENIVGVVQALVFAILTLVFMSIMTTPHHAIDNEGENH